MLGQSKENGTYKTPAVSRLKLSRDLALSRELWELDMEAGVCLSSPRGS